MQRLEVSGAVRPIYASLGVKWLKRNRKVLPTLSTVCMEHIRFKASLLCFVYFVILFYLSRVILHKASYRYPLETVVMFPRSDRALFNCRQDQVARRPYSGCEPCEQQDICRPAYVRAAAGTALSTELR